MLNQETTTDTAPQVVMSCITLVACPVLLQEHVLQDHNNTSLLPVERLLTSLDDKGVRDQMKTKQEEKRESSQARN